jgi:hypothetical protein
MERYKILEFSLVMGWRSQLLWPNLSGLKLEFQPENLKAPSEDPILQSQNTGIRIQRIDPPYFLYIYFPMKYPTFVARSYLLFIDFFFVVMEFS